MIDHVKRGLCTLYHFRYFGSVQSTSFMVLLPHINYGMEIVKNVYFEFYLDTHLCGLQNSKIEFKKISVCMYFAGSSIQTTEPL